MVVSSNKVSSKVSSALGSLGGPTLVREKAFGTLRTAIIEGALPPGTRLIERELCEAMGVSRTSVRETLRRLEAERLITSEPRRGPTVAGVTKAQAEQIYDIRSYFEGRLARKFAAVASDSDIVELRRIYSDFERFALSEDLSHTLTVMVEFYDHLKRVTQLDVMNDLLTQLTARVSYLRLMSMSGPNRIRYSIAEMNDLVCAIESRDEDAAERAAIEHVHKAAVAALARLND